MVHGEGSRHSSSTFAGAQPPDRFLALVFIELRSSTEPGSPSLGRLPAVVRPLHDALTLVLGHGAEKGNEATADGRGEVKVRLVDHLEQGAPRVDARHDVYTVEHAARGAVPLRQHQDVALAERIDGLLELRAVLDVPTTRFFSEDCMAMFRAQRRDLPIEILMG